MIPDLGKYAFVVLASYGVSLALLAVIIGLSLWRSREVRRHLEEIEQRQERDHG